MVPEITAIQRLEAAMREMPQAELPTQHYFADGMYCRVLPRPKNCLIVGKVHLKEHFYMVVSGCVRVTTDTGVRDVKAPEVIVSKPGTKRAVLALEDSVCLTVHRLDEVTQDLDKIELQLVEPDEKALYDSSNKLRIAA